MISSSSHGRVPMCPHCVRQRVYMCVLCRYCDGSVCVCGAHRVAHTSSKLSEMVLRE